MTDPTFNGFDLQIIQFYRNLALNNNRAWFEQQKPFFQNQVLTTAQSFVVELGGRLQQMAPGTVFDTRTNGSGSIFRIYRDTRFSKDKSPYKTNLAMLFWYDGGLRLEMPCYYVNIQPPDLMLGVGIYQFPTDLLARFRSAVADEEQGEVLRTIVDSIQAIGPYSVGEKHYKRVPKGYEQYEQNEFLLFNGLTASINEPIPPVLHSAEFADYCLQHFKQLKPINDWLVKLVTAG
jgi:uncharacterized protein (TIGR02453 family)